MTPNPTAPGSHPEHCISSGLPLTRRSLFEKACLVFGLESERHAMC